MGKYQSKLLLALINLLLVVSIGRLDAFVAIDTDRRSGGGDQSISEEIHLTTSIYVSDMIRVRSDAPAKIGLPKAIRMHHHHHHQQPFGIKRQFEAAAKPGRLGPTMVDFDDDLPHHSSPGGEMENNLSDQSRTIETSALAEPINDTSRLLTRAAEQPAQAPMQAANLNGGFLVLFDEITRMKNNSINALIRLQYFDYYPANKSGHSDANMTSRSMPNSNSSNNNNNYNYNSNNRGGGGQRGFDTDTTRPTIGGGHNASGNHLTVTMSHAVNNRLGLAQNWTQNLATKLNLQLSTWFDSLNKKVGNLMASLVGANQLGNSPLARQRLALRGVSTRVLPGRAAAASKTSGGRSFESKDPHELSKRQTEPTGGGGGGGGGADESALLVGRDGLAGGQSGERNCLEMDQSQVGKCRSTELLVSYNLNNSFPGTLLAIEENCRHISSLLAGCWPQQLQYLKNSLASWNESVLSMTDFPLPAGSSGGGGGAGDLRGGDSLAADQERLQATGQPNYGRQPAGWPSCGLRPQIPDLVMDRVNWMWLNLCMDRKFRLDYVENLKCLSLWTQERAQSVCSNEYKRMQVNLIRSSSQLIQAQSGDGMGSLQARQPRGIDFVPSVNIPTATAVNQQQQLQSQPQQQQLQHQNRAHSRLDDREIESKILCCIFDLFLRCVNRQAVRDCGRQGGQFVVNFMSRIGTDDMKYLCNAEPRSSTTTTMDQQQQQQQPHHNQPQHPFNHQQLSGLRESQQKGAGPKRNNNQADRSPFIQGNYCNDPRIVAVLYGKTVDVYGDRNRTSQSGAGGSGGGGGHSRPSPNGDHHSPGNHRLDVSYDPTYFEGSDHSHKSGSSRALDLGSYSLILSLTLTIIQLMMMMMMMMV